MKLLYFIVYITDVGMCSEVNACHPDATCYDTAIGPRCVCRSGYVGDGHVCSIVQGNSSYRVVIVS